MKILLCFLFLIAAPSFAEEDVFEAFDRTECIAESKTKRAACFLDGKKLPEDGKASRARLQDPELDAEAELEEAPNSQIE